MRHERSTEELRELAALYALGSLTQQEARSFENHMKEGCSVCETEFQKFSRGAAAIGFAAGEVLPPEYIRDLLSVRIERETQTRVPVPKPSLDEEETMQDFLRSRPAVPQLWSHQKPQRPSIFPWVLLIAVAALGLFAANLWRSADNSKQQLETQLSDAKSDAEDLRQKLGYSKQKAANLDEMMSILGKPSVRVARLVEQAATPASSGAVIWDTGENRCLVVGNFPPPPDGKRYQLWFFTPTAKISAGSIYVVTPGETFVSCPVPPEAAGAGAAVVTVEPDNGSQIPTSPYFAVGRIE